MFSASTARSLQRHAGASDARVSKDCPPSFSRPQRSSHASATAALAGPTSAAVQHFAGLGHPTPADVNVADMVLDLVIKSPVRILPLTPSLMPSLLPYRYADVICGGHGAGPGLQLAGAHIFLNVTLAAVLVQLRRSLAEYKMPFPQHVSATRSRRLCAGFLDGVHPPQAQL